LNSIPQETSIHSFQARAIALGYVGYARYGSTDRAFLVDAETPKKAQNAVKRYCEKQGLNVVRVNEGVEAERLPT
jgi:hypothetical protein